ncbi:glycoside hydrolase family 32 protein [Pseudalkalibacillus decolorationis]|uniref:glycoside hydrolase family 32 protein n=1 Tax=Pseudalkalibacillus decolorationis TaxID=163879 RepID=UPI002147BB0B|nr:glycoside hydrolase family 32 protein [Pseudalkalibacillus decolorationis]
MTINFLQKYKPHLHFAPKKNWMNDPNGLVYFEGEYHLFYQYNPYDSIWGPMHWGHAVSKDMIKWSELDIALYPDEHGTIFSGSAVVDWHNSTGLFPDKPGIVSIFTQQLEGSEKIPPKQSQSLAYSHDNGRTWSKYQGNPVLEHESKIDFRDPKVFWHKGTNKWVMVLATGQTISIYSSQNLIDWEFESEFGDHIGVHDGVWECPDLFQLKVENSEETKWVLFVSIGDNPQFDAGSRTQYFIGSFDGSQFTAGDESNDWLDFGKDNYAGVSFSDIPEKDGRRIYLGWMSNWRYANQVPTEGWRGQMTLPRELSLRKNGEVYKVIQKPVKELDSYFSNKEDINDVIGSGDGLKEVKINKSYLDWVLNVERIDATKFGIILHHTEEHFTRITFDSTENVVILDRKSSGIIDFSENFSNIQAVKMDNVNNIQLHMVIDSSSIELFVNEGEYAITSLIYPDKACENISIFAVNGKVKVSNSHMSTPVK